MPYRVVGESRGRSCELDQADAARQLTTAPQEVTIQVQPHPEGEQSTLVEIPYSRIRTHRQYAAPNQHGFTVTVTPLLAHADA